MLRYNYTLPLSLFVYAGGVHAKCFLDMVTDNLTLCRIVAGGARPACRGHGVLPECPCSRHVSC